MHELAAGHDTVPRLARDDPGKAGVFWTAQFVPFHCSASTWPCAPASPTAMQLVAVGQETPSSEDIVPVDGVVWTDHRVPFQDSASVV